MSKNLTRKGLAFGALVALGSTLIAGAPANAVGIDNNYVALRDTLEFGNYNMLTTGYIDLDGYFAGAAQLGAGAELKYYVEDPDAISVFDVASESISETSVVSTTNLTQIGAFNSAAGDIVSLTIATNGTAHNIEAGDAITVASLGATSTSAGFVIADLNKNQRVTRVTSLDLATAASGNIATAQFGAGSNSLDKITLTVDDASGLAAGDLITVALGAGSASGGTGTLADTEMEGTFVVESVSGNNVVYSANTGLTAGTGTWASSGAGTVKSDSISFVPGTEVTASTIAATTLSSQGSVAELTSGAAIDTLANLRTAAFGAAGVVGIATARSTTAATLNNYVVDTNEEDAAAGDQVVRFGTTSDTTAGSIKVTAWVDNDNDGVIDSTEYVSTTRTITFVKPASASFTISQEGVYIGSDSVTGVVSADLNLAEIGAQSLLELSLDHIDVSVPTTRAEDSNLVLGYDSTDKNLQATDSNIAGEGSNTALMTGDSIRLAVVNASDNVELGSPATFGVGSLVVAGSTMVVEASANNTEAVIKDADGTGASTANSTVRSKTASVSATYSAFDGTPLDTTTDKVVAGVPYTATVTSSAVTSADGVKINATVVDGGTETFTGVTDASGQIKLTLTQTAADASDWVQVSLDVQGKTTSGVVKFTYADADYDVYNAAGELSASTDYNQSVKIAGSLAQKYIVADQFGIAPVNGTMVVTATRAAAVARVTTAATWGYQVPVVDGKATVTIVDNGAGTGSDTVTIKALEITGGGALSTEHDSNTYTLSYVSTDADYTPKGVTATLDYDGVDDTATNDDPIAVSAKTLASFDTRATAGKNAPVLETYNVNSDNTVNATVDAQLTLSGSVSNASAGLIVGTPVTISAKGLLFAFTTAGSKTIYGMDTITVNTDAAGAYSVEVYGDRGGKQTITVTAGAATASAAVTFAVGTPAVLDLKTTKVAKSGRAVDVVATVTDKYGVGSKGSTGTFVTSGAGYLNSASGVTDANGKVSLKLILGSDEKGITTITATTTIAAADVTKTGYTFTGVSAKITKAATSSAVVKNAAGATVKIVRGTKTTTKTASSNSFKISVKGGSGSVKVYVNGVKVASK